MDEWMKILEISLIRENILEHLIELSHQEYILGSTPIQYIVPF